MHPLGQGTRSQMREVGNIFPAKARSASLASNSQRSMDKIKTILCGILEAHASTPSALIAAIRERRADLTVLGTQGRGSIAGLLMDTTAEKIVSHAPCSILAIKPEDFPDILVI